MRTRRKILAALALAAAFTACDRGSLAEVTTGTTSTAANPVGGWPCDTSVVNPDGTPASCGPCSDERDPCWDCATMGDLTCQPGEYKALTAAELSELTTVVLPTGERIDAYGLGYAEGLADGHKPSQAELADYSPMTCIR